MSATYTAGSVSPVHRLRRALRDTSTTTPLLDDDDYTAFLRASRSLEALIVWLPEGLGFTSATAEVVMASSTLTLKLKRGSDTADSIALAPSGATVHVDDVIDQIRALDLGWICGLADGVPHEVQVGRGSEEMTWKYRTAVIRNDGAEIEWRDTIVSPILACIATGAQAGDLALTEGTVTAYGGSTEAPPVLPARLRFYRYADAALAALVNIEQSLVSGRIKRKKDGDMEREYADLESLREVFSVQAGFGIYGSI